MRRLWVIMLCGWLAAATVPTARADDEPKDKAEESSKSKSPTEDKDAKKSGDKEKSKSKDEKKPDPIKKLVELTLDPFLVPARTFNIALPGRTKELRDVLGRFEKWGKDEDVGAVLLNLDGVALAIPDIEELRAGMSEFRKTGKRVFAFLNSGDPMGYLLACEADEIAIAPTGSLIIPGIGRLFPFMRGYYQMQGLEFDVITAGRFKYPGFMNAREPNRYFQEEFTEILDSWYGDYVKIIATGRKMPEPKVRAAIDAALFNAQEAKNRGLVDTIAYFDEFRDRVLRREKFKKSEEGASDLANITSLQDLLSAVSKQMKEAQESYKAVGPKIAVLHARGPIIDDNLGPGLSSMLIMRDEFVKTVEEIRKNKTIQAVVLRIDSPGGSGYASDVIWRKLRELDEEKPLVVSMGTVAGSGGYYIACPGRLIFAEPTTITGSIGVLAILPNQASMLNRIDVNLAEMKRGKRALLGAGHRDMAPEDRDLIQRYILDFYEIFLDRVAATRKMPKNEVRKIAEGRIYTGRDAMKIGLVDRLGGLKDAIAAVREMANIPASAEIKIVHYPRPSSLGEFIEGFMGMSAAMDVYRQSQTPAGYVSFDSQLRFFARQPKPLCWMAVPGLVELVRPAESMSPVLDLSELLPSARPVPVAPTR